MKIFLKVLMTTGKILIIITALLLSIAVVFTIRYKSTTAAHPHNCTIPDTTLSLCRYVDPFIGTGGFPPYTAGDDMPGATVPFGMVRLSPDTKFFLGSYLGDGNTVSTAGYYYGDNRLMGFSHTRLVGTGAADGGSFRVIPGTGDNVCEDYLRGRYLKFSHSDETAYPGYYSLNLKKPGIRAELTASLRTGVHRYTFSANKKPHILIDVSSVLGNGRTKDGELTIDTAGNEVYGSIITFGSFSKRYNGLKVYFAARLSEKIRTAVVWEDGVIKKNISHASGAQLGADLQFENLNQSSPLIVKFGISYVSIENARLNRETETGNKGFDEISQDALKLWKEKLSLIKLEGGDPERRKIFYTALYHSFQMPTIFNDVNGEYTGFDRKVHKAEGFTYFTDLSLWDTFRTIHPLFNLIDSTDQRSMMESLVTMCRQGGSLPRWPSGGGYTGSMIGSSADIVITEAYLKGIRGFAAETAYQAMKKAALAIDVPKDGFRPRPGMKDVLKYGYLPDDIMDKSVSRTLEYAYADKAVARLAKALGHYGDTALFEEHSGYFRNLWNPQTLFFQPRTSNGEFVNDFQPFRLIYLDPDIVYTKSYCEGSALQWRWALFFDPGALIGLFESREKFIKELNSFFEHSDPKLGNWYPGPYYWHGNEPDIHTAYLFNTAGRPDLTQKWVKWILDNKYSSAYDGIDGDDDAGTLSAWYVFSSLGFYPVAGSDLYQIGTPLFSKAEIKTGENIFTVTASNLSPENIYISEILLNGKRLDRYWLKHSEIAEGGTLHFEMTGKPVSADGLTSPKEN